MKLSIRNKMLLGYTLILILSVVTQTVGFRITEQFITFQTEQILQEKAETAAKQIQSFTSKIELDQLGIAREFLLDGTKNPSEVINIINFTFRQNPFFQTISILSPTGRELMKVDRFTVTPTENLYFELPTDAFKEAEKGHLGISKVYFTENDTVPHTDIYTPILSERGIMQGIVKGQLRLDRLWEVIAESKLGKSGFAYVVDEEGRLIAHSNLDLVLQGPNFAARPIVATLLHEDLNTIERNNIYRNEKDIEVIAEGIKLANLHWAVVVEQPIAEAFKELILLKNLFYSALIASFILLIIISFLLSGNITRPINMLTAFTKRIKRGDYDQHISVTSGDEIEDLGTSLNIMATQLNTNVSELHEKITLLEAQKKQLDQSNNTIIAERNKLSVILSGIRDAVIAVDSKHLVILFNSAAERITGYRAADIINRPIQEVIKLYTSHEEIKPDTYAPILADEFEGIVYEQKNVMLLGKAGKETFVNVISGKIKESKQSNLGCILTFHNISEERRFEEMKIDFVSMAAHELRTPLTIIRGYAETLQIETKPLLSPDQQEYVNRVVISAKNLSDLIDNLLNVSKIEQGRFKVELTPVNIQELAKEIVTSLQNAAHSKKQELIGRIPDNLPFIKADHVRIAQVLSNLVANAINYTPAGGIITVSARTISKPEKTPSEYVEISVQDTGQGIPKDALPMLFTKFFRVSGTLEQGSKGTGLGLFISKSIIAMHNGEIWAESELGKGATFTFIIPILSTEEKQHPSPLLPTTKHGIILNKDRYH